MKAVTLCTQCHGTGVSLSAAAKMLVEIDNTAAHLAKLYDHMTPESKSTALELGQSLGALRQNLKMIWQ